MMESVQGDRFLPYPDPELADDLVLLRPWRIDDLECIEEGSSDPAITEATTVPETFTASAGRAFVTRQRSRQADGEGLSLAIANASDGRARGLIVLLVRPTRGAAGIGYCIVPSARGFNRASRAVRLLSQWAFREATIERLEALVEPENVASQRVLEASGFQAEGVLRSYLAFRTRRADAISFSLLLDDLAKN